MTKSGKMVSERSGCVFNMEYTAQSLSQVNSENISDVLKPQTKAILGKLTHKFTPNDRDDRIQHMKAERKCRGCGEYGHWFCYISECAKKVQYKDGNRNKDWTRAENEYQKQDETTENAKVNTFFLAGGSYAPY